MGEIIKKYNDEITPVNEENILLEVSQDLLIDARTSYDNRKTLSVPIAELSSLGAGVSSLIPKVSTVTHTTTFATDGLYTLANQTVGDTLKVAKNGNFWGAFKTTEGKSKFAQLQAADPINATTTTHTVAAFNPATMMMAVALYSIEKDLGKIEDTQKQILSFMETEKESAIEADVESLMSIVRKYKTSWDNELYIAGNHNQVLEIQKTARGNMNSYQKKVAELIDKKQHIVARSNVKQVYNDFERNFKYYRLSLYTFSLASFMEIMLSGNFNEEYIAGIRKEVWDRTVDYRSLFEKSSRYLEKMGGASLEANVLKGVGTAGKTAGKIIGKIPVIKRGPVDEFLQDSGSHIKRSGIGLEKKAVYRFSSLSNPSTHVFMSKMDDMVQIYNHTDQICFDDKRIYLIANNG